MKNRLDLINVASNEGYIAFLPVVDEGIDLILYREAAPRDFKLVQLKSRWTIDKKYIGRRIWIAFPENDVWYLAPHDTFLGLSKKLGFAGNSSAWTKKGKYSKGKLNRALLTEMKKYIFPRQTRAGSH